MTCLAQFLQRKIGAPSQSMSGANLTEQDMTLLNRRGLLGAGSAMLAVAAFANKTALAAGSPGLTTHVLDTANGKPGEGIKIEFSVLDGETYKLLKTVTTNADGRNAQPLLTPENMKAGKYQLVFYVGEYFAKQGTVVPNPPFLEKAVIQFGMADATAHYH